MEMYMKPLRWLADSKRRIREFPQEARQRAGFELWEVQQGHEPSDWKPMPTVGQGVNEIGVDVKGEYRVLYVAKFEKPCTCFTPFRRKRNGRQSRMSRLRAIVIEHCCKSV